MFVGGLSRELWAREKRQLRTKDLNGFSATTEFWAGSLFLLKFSWPQG
jgi:hypothetical protein